MQAEPRLLLQDFVTEPHNYVAILRAIAGGARAQNEIATRTGLAQGHLLEFIGTHTWEELCREWVLRAGARGVLPLSDRVGSFWSRTAQVDVVGIHSMEKTLLIGECKWSPRPMGADVLETLLAKTAEVVPKHGRWTVHRRACICTT
jgi:hypothetical protein